MVPLFNVLAGMLKLVPVIPLDPLKVTKALNCGSVATCTVYVLDPTDGDVEADHDKVC